MTNPAISPTAQRLSQDFVTSIARFSAGSQHIGAAQKSEIATFVTQYYSAPNESMRLDATQHLGWTVWRSLEEHLPKTFKFYKGLTVELGFNVITLHHPLNDLLFRYLHGVTGNILYRAPQLMIPSPNSISETIVPRADMLRRMMASAFAMGDASWQWVAGEVDRDDIFKLHQADRIMVGLPLFSIELGDIERQVDPLDYIMHDLMHGVRFATASPIARRLAEAVYVAARAVESVFLYLPERGSAQELLRRVIDMEFNETAPGMDMMRIYRPEMEESSFAVRFFELLYVQLGLRDWVVEHRPHVDAMMAQIVDGLQGIGNPGAKLHAAKKMRAAPPQRYNNEEARQLAMMLHLADGVGDDLPESAVDRWIFEGKLEAERRASVQKYLGLTRPEFLRGGVK